MRAIIFLAATVACFYYAGTHDSFNGGIALASGCNFVWVFVAGFAKAARADYLARRR